MVRCFNKRWGVVAVLAASSAGVGLVEANTSVDVADLYPDCEGVLAHIADGYCDRYGEETNNVEECGFDGGDCCSCTCQASTEWGCDPQSFRCNDTSAECYGEPNPTQVPVVESEDADTDTAGDDSSAPFSRMGSSTATAAGALVVSALCGGFAVASQVEDEEKDEN
eukprot:g10397.t1